MEIVCTVCSKSFQRKTSKVNEGIRNNWKVLCSSACMAADRNKGGKEYQCFKCSASVWKSPATVRRSKEGRVFCSRSCSASSNNALYKTGPNHPNWKDSSSGYRQKALKHYGTKCMSLSCPVSKVLEVEEKMLDVDHIDSDRSNSNIENLQVLCVWCHAVKTRRLW